MGKRCASRTTNAHLNMRNRATTSTVHIKEMVAAARNGMNS